MGNISDFGIPSSHPREDDDDDNDDDGANCEDVDDENDDDADVDAEDDGEAYDDGDADGDARVSLAEVCQLCVTSSPLLHLLARIFVAFLSVRTLWELFAGVKGRSNALLMACWTIFGLG